MAQNSLKDLGWHINPSAIPELHPSASVNEIIKRALDLDLRQIAETKSTTESKTKTSVVVPLVLQLQKSLNIAVPKDQSETSLQGNARRLLLLTLTDGNATYQAVEMQPIRGLSMDTPPGTKLRLNGEVSIWKGFLQLYPNNAEVLGGNVAKLASAWQLSRELGSRAAAMLKSQNQRQQTGPGGHGPPAFVPFGQRIPNKYDAASTDNFRAMEVVGKDKAQGSSATEEDGVDEFSEQRQAAIEKAKQKQKPGEADKKLAIPDISQLSIATKPPSAPPARPAPVVAAAVGDEERERPGRSFGGRGRRGRNYEDDYEAQASMGRPTQFRLFDVIQQQQGQDKLKLVAETAALSTSFDKPTSSSGGPAGRRYDEEQGSYGGGGRGGYRGGRGGRGNWRGGRGSSAGQSRSSYPTSRGGQGVPPPLFREGSAASSRGVDSASPTSEGGRGGTGNRDLPPRLKRHQQNQPAWPEESPVMDGGSFFPSSKARNSTGYPGEVENDDTFAGGNPRRSGLDHRISGGRVPQPQTTGGQSMPLLPTPGTGQMAAIYPQVVTADGTQFANPDQLMQFASAAGYTPIFATPFVGGVTSPPPTTTTAAPASVQTAGQQSVGSVSTAPDWRPGNFCLARWTDGGFYPAQVISVDPASQTCIVNYYQYSECQSVPLTALHPISLDGTNATAALTSPLPVMVTLPAQQATAEMLRQQHSQQQRMMWLNPGGGQLLPQPPPFPGIESFQQRLSTGFTGMTGLDPMAVASMAPQMIVPSTASMMTAAAMVAPREQPGLTETSDKAVEQPNNDTVPVETAVAAG